MNFRQLRTFVTICEQGSLGRASDTLHVAQPALSRQIRMLEEELDAVLFHRHAKGMTLTAKGTRLYERAQLLLEDLADICAEIRAPEGAITGSVVLGLPPTIAELISARVVSAFIEQCPAVSLRIVPAFSGYLAEWLARGAIDVAIMHEPPCRDGIRLEPLFEEDLFLIGPPGEALAFQDGIDFAQIARLPLVLPQPMHGIRRLLETRAHAEGAELRLRLEADSLQMQKDFVARGLGWTILPIATLQSELAQGELSAAPIRPRLSMVRHFALPGDRVTSPAADKLIHVIRRQAHLLSAEMQGGSLRMHDLAADLA